MVTGWGRVSESGAFAHILQKVQLPLMPVDTCLNMYNEAGYGDFVSRCVMCGGGTVENEADSCQVCRFFSPEKSVHSTVRRYQKKKIL